MLFAHALTSHHSVVFKYAFTSYAEKRMREIVKWAAVARLAQRSGFWGVLVIRYSIVPPREYPTTTNIPLPIEANGKWKMENGFSTNASGNAY